MTGPQQQPANNTAPAEPAPAPRYATVWEWVEGWFAPHIRRHINPKPGSGLSWDRYWWRYPETVARLLALHAAWEEASASASASAMSTWWISHLEPHLRVLLDGETGPMSHPDPDSKTFGHPPLQLLPVPDDTKRHYEPLGALADLTPKYADVWAWMENWFVKVVRRRINPKAGAGLSWDPRWWGYPEIVARFQALHAAWEHALASESPSAMSTWWVSHLDNHLRVIFDSASGPMSQAGPDVTFTGHPELATTPLPEVVKRQLAPAR
ncbi:DUF4913 domain-containing protein (plasmid) [Nocardia sp. CA-084685]|uniref:DUF4913 domain-containing protein n=1 Tax=Nocardia sp. CA-084685 TaxID=3239970 RepID=UPI003D97D67A